MSAAPARDRSPAGSQAAAEWEQIRQAAPALAAVMLRYLTRAAAFLAPRSVDVADAALRQLSRFLLADTVVRRVADISRDDIEDYKVWLSGQPGIKGGSLSANTHRQRLRTLRAFFERIIEWDWPEAPPRNPVLGGDIPKKPAASQIGTPRCMSQVAAVCRRVCGVTLPGSLASCSISAG